MLSTRSPFVLHFASLEDPRVEASTVHPFLSVLAIAVLAALCGIDSFAGMETFAIYKLEWLKTFLDLPNDAPSHDTFNRIFARIKPDKFQACFAEWMKAVVDLLDGEVVAIDGKTLRRSFDKRTSKAPIHMVSAWATANGVALGQIKVDDKSNEITAIPKLLDMLCLKGCIVTIDAMGCQRDICEKIVEGGANYTIALKGNQGTLFDDVKAVFDRYGFDDQRRMVHHTTRDHGHGRDEERL
jgi:predicted transposase YbfD/YdcC